MLKEGIISKDEDIPYKIESNLKDYDALKQYYFTISEDGEIDKELSLSILNNVKNFREKALYLITDTKDREQVSETLAELEELAENINDINSVLLERLLEDLMSVISRNEHQTDLMILYIPFFADFANVKKKSNGRAATRMVSSFIQALQNSYIVSNDNKNFYKLLDGLVDIVARFYKSDNENIRTLGTELLDGILNAVFVCIYSPISQGGLSKSSDEYKLREQTFYTAFNRISSKISYSKIPFSYLFAEKPARTSAKVSYYDDNNSIFGPGLNAKTLNLYMKFVKKAPDKNIIVPIPKRDTDISDIHQLAKIFAQDCESIDLSMFCNNLIDTGENGRELSLAIIKNLLTLCEDNSISKELKYNVASTLARMASTELYIYYQDKNLFNIDKINELCRINKVPLYLKPVSSSYIILEAGRFSRRDGESLRGQYRFTDLLRYLPKDTLGRIQNVVNEAPVIYSTQGSVETKNEDVSVITAKFNTLRTILDNNSIILSLLDGLSSSKNSDKDFSDIIKILYEMIEGLNLINSAHGNAAKEA
ncbi:MAG: hypothetical protein II816_05430, partial [Elusimicrobia bacterium]|nr:hypothetical protein [Elusimicrobiota bacterium]